jgi:ATP/maltotriose-dependent transcriptional regulator MalT
MYGNLALAHVNSDSGDPTKALESLDELSSLGIQTRWFNYWVAIKACARYDAGVLYWR